MWFKKKQPPRTIAELQKIVDNMQPGQILRLTPNEMRNTHFITWPSKPKKDGFTLAES